MPSPARHTGHCHCRAVSLTIAAPPPNLNSCNCSMCAKTAGLWGYFHPADVVISGETRGYIRADMEKPFLATHFCSRCGVVTHWSPLPRGRQDRMGVNMRLFPDATLAGLPRLTHDGRSWPLS